MKKRNIIGIICIVFLAAMFLISSLNSTHNTKHFENNYISFDYPSSWIVNDTSSNGSLRIILNDSNDGTSGEITTSDIESMQTAEEFQKGKTATGYALKNGTGQFNGMLDGSYLGAYITNGSKCYFLRLDSGNPSIPDNAKSGYNTIINSMHFK